MRMILYAASIVVSVLYAVPGTTQDATDLLILQDIGTYTLSTPKKLIPGFPPVGGPLAQNNSGALAEVDHFPFHGDVTAKVFYHGGKGTASPTVTVTRHAGDEADQWLSHEVDAAFRNYGQPARTYILDTIEGNAVITRFIGGAEYRWLSGNTVVHIEYHDSTLGKTKPLEVIKAYLAKYPSTLRTTSYKDLVSKENKTAWIREEMERRLWLCDAWLKAIGAGTVRIGPGLSNIADSLKSFNKYRKKYYGLKSLPDERTIDGYAENLQGSEIKALVQESRTWWSSKRSGSLILDLSSPLSKDDEE
ncbi:MAG: hypothetical protein OEW15_15030 [Nitrospirota bacterium]|nr:hypothetical protein [Nitrospirota bacterium]